MFFRVLLIAAVISYGQFQIRKVNLGLFSRDCMMKNMTLLVDVPYRKVINNILSMRVIMTFLEDLDDDAIYQLEVTRCKSKENLDTCEHFHSFKCNMCTLLRLTTGDWTSLYNFTPPLKCPLKKGKYVNPHAVIDMKSFLLVPTESWYWDVTGKIIDRTKKVVMCMRAGAHIFL